ncbi:Nidogen-1 [Eumeta japonica]|uniref:Nidogen-1 n=1 Tax=Eumeta variegata TaxID=151549 RepID=A0A4C1WVL6_EUMVA|nr:Nidogen-1 [Eumeta japonica]
MWTRLALTVAAACAAHALSRDQFYPYGPGLDVQLPKGYEIASPEIKLKVPVVFYGEIYDSIYVNNYGVVSFRSNIPTFLNAEFPLPYPAVAGLYTNVDTSSDGTVYYRETDDNHVKLKADETVQENFPEYYDFRATSVFVVTWAEVAAHNPSDDNKRNTFQIAIISNGTESFVEMLYPERDIQWFQGEPQTSILPDAKAQAGFVSEDGRVFNLRGSGSHQIRNIASWTNTREPGKYIFRVGVISPVGNIAVPDQYNQNDIEDYEMSKTCAQSGPSVCHTHARCVDYQAGICCRCNEGYYGNGMTCIKTDIPIRVHGKLYGEINGTPLNEVDIQSYVVVAEGRSYTALSQAPSSLGSSLQLLNVLGSVVGWLFAKPVGDSKNGYQLTGSVFNHSADITFIGTNNRITIRQEFMGHDVFDQITLEADIRGTIPILGPLEKVEVKEQQEQYTLVEPGLVRSESTRIFISKQTGLSHELHISQTFNFNYCRYAPPEEEDLNPSTLIMTKNYLNYESQENIVRYGISNKIVPLGQEDPCIQGRSTCGPHSSCLVQGSSYVCLCNSGFSTIYDSGKEICVDIDECYAGTHNCDTNAQCLNYDGSFTCKCLSGFEGDGITCTRQLQCNNIQCDINADCFERQSEAPICVCKAGFTGDGSNCWPVQSNTCDILNNCSPHGSCVPSTTSTSYTCECNAGFVGDGYTCITTEANVFSPSTEASSFSPDRTTITSYRQFSTQSTTEEQEKDNPQPACNNSGCVCPAGYVVFVDHWGIKYCRIDTTSSPPDQYSTQHTESGVRCAEDADCPPNAVCRYMPSGYECQCLEGYSGDGYECIEPSPPGCDLCGPNGHCLESETGEHTCVCDVGFQGDGYTCRPNLICFNNSDCEYNAECRYDFGSAEYMCQCLDGYVKDQNDACIRDGHLCNGALCAEHATCLYDSKLLVNYCQCDVGFDGDGVQSCMQRGTTCDIVNDCSPDGLCIKNEYTNQYSCMCKEGFIGDGYSCTPEPTCRNDPYLCDKQASCLLRSGSFVCECNSGYTGNGSYCDPIPRKPGNFLLASGGMFIYRVPFEMNARDYATPIQTANDQIAVGMDVDCETGRVYWGDVLSNNIKSSAYDGSLYEAFIYSGVRSPEGLAIDWVSRNIYWTDSKLLSIEVANLDTKVKKTLFSDIGMSNPRGIAVHPQRGKLFWSDWNRNGPKIEWSNLDGTEREIFLSSKDVMLPNSLAIDWATENLCYADAGLKSIECVNLDTKRRETIARNCTYPFGLAITQQKFYWTDWRSQKIEFIDRQTGLKGIVPISTSGGRLYGITVAADHCPGLRGPCERHGGCAPGQMCLPRGPVDRTCFAP